MRAVVSGHRELNYWLPPYTGQHQNTITTTGTRPAAAINNIRHILVRTELMMETHMGQWQCSTDKIGKLGKSRRQRKQRKLRTKKYKEKEKECSPLETSLPCFIAQFAREPVVCIPRGKIGTWCNIFANTVFGKHFDESDNGYIHREGRRFKCSWRSQ